MSRKEFIRKNREEIDEHIKIACPNTRLNDGERELWISNDEVLYRWARREGANF